MTDHHIKPRRWEIIYHDAGQRKLELEGKDIEDALHALKRYQIRGSSVTSAREIPTLDTITGLQKAIE